MTQILVISNDDLLLTGITRMLGNNFSITVHRVLSTDEKEMISKTQQSDIEAVIVDTSLISSGLVQMTSLLNSNNKLRILLMNINSNEVQVYDRWEARLEHSGDLLAILGYPDVKIGMQSSDCLTP